MRNKRLLWCLGAGVLLLLAGFALFVVVRVLPDRVTPENYYRIAEGMTQGEVEAILGRPADRDNIWEAVSHGKYSIWEGEEWLIGVRFDDHGVVSWRKDHDNPDEFRSMYRLRPPPTFWQKLRRSLGW
jgi:hypothetical protein